MSSTENKKNKKNVIYAGVDDGYAETKIVLSTGESIRIPSLAKAGQNNQISIGGSDVTVYSYKTNEGEFIIGDIREADSTAFDDYPVSAQNRVIVMHALRQAGIPTDATLSICSGLPIKKFYKRGDMNQELVKAKRKNLLTNDVVAMDGSLLPKVFKHDVVSEGIAAWFDIVFTRDSEGKLVRDSELIKERIAIIDIGGRTTDIAVIQGGNLDSSRSSTIEVGILAVQEAVADAIYDEFDGAEPTVEQMREVMEDGRIKLWGKYHSVSNIVEDAKKMIVSRIEAEVKKRLGNASDLDRVVFVGGTVVKIEGYLDGWFRQQEIAKEPSAANARGMCKFAEMMMSR